MRRTPSRTPPAEGPVLELHRSRLADVEGASVRRAIPHAKRRAVGAWCFLDHFGPAPIPAGSRGMDVAPHPHCGLATVTWLISGEVVHKDSLGSEQRIRPGQLNWMTAGRGISHAEEGVVAEADTVMHGVQLWVALPAATRDQPARFDHHAELPTASEDGLDVTVLVGEHAGLVSPARADTDLIGLELILAPGTHRLPLQPSREHAVVVTEGAVTVEGERIEPGTLAYLGTQRTELHLTAEAPARVMLVGGEPLDEALLMGWNFVVRSHEELEEAFRSWEEDDGRFGTVVGARGERLSAPRRG